MSRIIFSFCALCAGLCHAFPDANSIEYSVPDAEHFFAAVNLEFDGLGEVKDAVERNDYAAAVEHYCGFVTERMRPRASSRDQSFEGILEKADGEIQTYLKDGALRADLVWQGKPAQHFAFRNRMGYLGTLARAYAESGNDTYLDAFRVIIAAWIRDNPLGIKLDPDSSTPWHILDVSARSSVWSSSLPLLQESRRFTVQERFEIYRSLMQHRKILEDYNAGAFRLSNFRTTGLTANLRLVLSFPEWKQAGQSRDHCMARLERHLTEGFNADGFQSEMTPNYHYHVLNGFRAVQKLVHDDYGYPGFSDAGVKMIERAYWLLDVLRKPNGALPAIGDAPRRGDTPNAQPPEGVNVDFESRLLPASGLALMKSGTDHMGALYCLFDNAPAGTGTHSHWDYLNIELFAYGRTHLHDPGTGLYYREPMHDGYFKTAKAHNVVMVDGVNPNSRIQDSRRVYNDAWQSNEVYDYARGVLKGYAGVDHVREVLFVKGRYWILRDTIIGEDDHTMEQMFHFDAGALTVDETTKSVSSQYDTTANLAVIPVNPSAVEITMDEGFLTDKTNNRYIPLPMVKVVSKGNGRIQSTLVLVPRRQGEALTTSVTAYSEKDDEFVRFSVESEKGALIDNFVFEQAPSALKAEYSQETRTFHLAKENTE